MSCLKEKFTKNSCWPKNILVYYLHHMSNFQGWLNYKKVENHNYITHKSKLHIDPKFEKNDEQSESVTSQEHILFCWTLFLFTLIINKQKNDSPYK